MSDQSHLQQALQGLKDQPDQLIAIILKQSAAIETLQAHIRKLEEQIKDLDDKHRGQLEKIEQLEKAAARQAAPFRIKDKHRSLAPGKPGRKAGHKGSYRPMPEYIDEHIEVPLKHCPECGKALEQTRPLVQYIEEIPQLRPRVIELTTHEGDCPCCGKRVRSSHPLQVSLANGAAKVHLGPRALALAAQLNKGYGVTLRKVSSIFGTFFGLKISPGAITQAMAKMARKLQPNYQDLLAQIRGGPFVHGDETSWWVGGPGWWLWVFATPKTTVYRVEQGRGRNIVVDTLGQDYKGVLISDCLSIYDDVNSLQHKCYSHHLKAISQAHEQAPSDYLESLRGLLLAAIALKKAGLDDASAKPLRQRLQEQADQLLSTPRSSGPEERVRKRLFKQRDHLFTFLEHPEVQATNNLAERQLRPAVIARKVSCGNKTQAGAHAWEILTSLAATCRQRGESFTQTVINALSLQPSPEAIKTG